MTKADVLVDKNGRPRSAATMPEFRKGKPNANKGKKFPAEPPTDEEVLTLIDGRSRTSAIGKRDRAIIALLWRSGLRIQEALDLHIRDLNFGAATIHVRHGKGDKDRFVIMDPFGWEFITPWLEHRAKLPGVLAESGPVFCTVSKPAIGGPIASPQVRSMLKRTAEIAGIQKRIHPHGLRHAAAVGMYEETGDLRVVSAQLGHSNMAITDRYVNHMSTAKRAEIIGGRPDPRGLVDLDPTSVITDAISAAADAVQRKAGESR